MWGRIAGLMQHRRRRCPVVQVPVLARPKSRCSPAVLQRIDLPGGEQAGLANCVAGPPSERESGRRVVGALAAVRAGAKPRLPLTAFRAFRRGLPWSDLRDEMSPEVYWFQVLVAELVLEVVRNEMRRQLLGRTLDSS